MITTMMHPIPQSNAQGWEWPVQIVLITFGTQVLLRSIAPRRMTDEGFDPTLEFGDPIFKLFWLIAAFISANRAM
jgi:hypothetical protein